jgi:hypothetical protein
VDQQQKTPGTFRLQPGENRVVFSLAGHGEKKVLIKVKADQLEIYDPPDAQTPRTVAHADGKAKEVLTIAFGPAVVKDPVKLDVSTKKEPNKVVPEPAATLRISSMPPGATVYVNQVEEGKLTDAAVTVRVAAQGKTPVEIELVLGDHDPERLTVLMMAGADRQEHFDLKKSTFLLKHQLQLTTNPSGADVYINGKLQPVKTNGQYAVPDRPYELKLALANYVHREIIDPNQKGKNKLQYGLLPVKVGLVRKFTGIDTLVTNVGGSPQGDFVVAAAITGEVLQWDAKGGQQPLKLVFAARDALPLKAIGYSRDGQYIFVMGGPTVNCWQAKDGKWAWETNVATKGTIKKNFAGVGLAMDPNKLVFVGDNGVFGEMDIRSGAYKVKGAVSNYPVSLAVVCPDGIHVMLVHAGSNKIARVNMQDFNKSSAYSGHTMAVAGLAVSPITQHVASCGKEGLVVWDPDSDKELWKHPDSFLRVAFSPNGKRVLACKEKDTKVYLYDALDGKLLRAFDGHAQEPNALAFLTNELALSAGWDHDVYLWRLPD